MTWPQRFSRVLAGAFLGFLIGLVITLASAAHQAELNRRRIEQVLDLEADRTVREVLERIRLYQYGLRGARGAVLTAGDDGVSRTLFRRYSQSRDIGVEFPGARGFGFIRRVAPDGEKAFLERARADGEPDFSIRQLTPHEGERYVIQYIEPDAQNRQALGLDIASERQRRQAAEAAMRTGEVRLTGPITLVQSSGLPQQSFLILMPIYRGAVTPSTETERMRQGFGWSYAPLTIHDVLSGLSIGRLGLDIDLTDVDSAGNSLAFYSSRPGGASPAADYSRVIEREIFGRHWRMRFAAEPEFVADLGLTSPRRVLLVGSFGSSLAAALIGLWLSNRRRRREAIAGQIRLAAIVENSSDAIIGKDLDGAVTHWNREAVALFGFSAEEAIGRPMAELIIPDECRDEETDILTRIRRGERIPHFDTVRRHRDGRLLDVSAAISPILDENGQVIGASTTLHDIGGKKAVENRIRELNVELENQVRERTADLELARATLRTVLDAMPSMIGYWDKTQINRIANHAYRYWFRVDPEQVPGMHMRALLGENLYRRNLPHIEAVLRGEPQSFERILPKGNAQERHLLIQYLPDIRGDEVQGFYTIAHDVSELVESRLQLASALREKQVLLTTINEQLLYAVTDAEGRIIDINENFCRVMGYSREELLGKNHQVINSGLHPRAMRQAIWSVLTSGKTWKGEIRSLAAGSSMRWLDCVVAPFFGADGDIERYVALCSDVTARKAAEAQRNEAMLLLENVLNAASEVSIIATTPEGVIRIFNSGAERMLGYRASEMIGHQTPAIIHLPEEVAQRGRALSREYGETVEGFRVFVLKPEREGAEVREWHYRRKDGSVLCVSLVVTAMRDEQGNITGYLGIATDITRRKLFESELINAKQVAELASVAKGQFLANMSHEIRTPLNAILGLLELALHTELDVRQRDYITKTRTAAKSLLGLLNDILDFSKIEADKLQLDVRPFNLDGLMRDLAVVLSGNLGDKDVELMFAIEPGLPVELIGDRLRLQQILLNLAGNAIKFTPHGHILVALEEVERNHRAVTIRFSVRDTGIGIAPEHQKRIFEGFNQAEASISRRFGGTGLGLAISRRLVAMMHGQLQVESELGKGARFWFEIPLDIADIRPVSHPIAERRLRVLVVDDNLLVGEILSRSAAAVGWRVDFVDSGEKAIERCRQAQESGSAYDVILMDWRMPSLDGISAARSIRTLSGAESPVVVMVSAHGREILAKEQVRGDAPFVDFLTKPITPMQLFETVLRAVDARTDETRGRLDPVASNMRLRGLRLLVVEDNALNRQVADELLRFEGAKVDLAEGGLEGVAKVFDAREPYDVVIMDVQMPDIDGLEATRRIRADGRFSELPILAMTANATLADKKACLDAGMNGHVGKPVDMEELVPSLLALSERRPGDLAGTCHSPGKDETVESLTTILRRFVGKRDVYHDLLERFPEEAAELLQRLHSAIAENDMASALHVLHSYKGVAATMGACALARRLGELEQQLKAASPLQPVSILSQEALAELEALQHQSQASLAALLPDTEHTLSLETKAAISAQDEQVWLAGLCGLMPLLQSGNLHALERVDELRIAAPPAWRGQMGLLSAQVHALNFSDAVTALDRLLKVFS